jgi:hypothetical protein
MARLLSVNVGRPRDNEWQGKTVHTGSPIASQCQKNHAPMALTRRI